MKINSAPARSAARIRESSRSTGMLGAALAILLASIATLGEARDPPPPASTTAVQQPPAQQGPSQPLPSQAPPAPGPGAGQQAAQMAQQAAAVEGNPDWA